MSESKLKFSSDNQKLGEKVLTFSIPAGFSCPGALQCLSKADPDVGTITDGPKTEFRCFSATLEAAFKNVRAARWHNFKLLTEAKSTEAMTRLIIDGLGEHVTRSTKAVRIHVAGDFFNQDYFDAWLNAARDFSGTKFYAYTKSLPFWVARLKMLPENLALVASRGGKHDALIDKFKLPSAVVVFHPEEAEAKGLEIDHNDTLAMQGKTFALLIHGTGPAGSKHAAALKRMDAEGITYSYSRARAKTSV